MSEDFSQIPTEAKVKQLNLNLPWFLHEMSRALGMALGNKSTISSALRFRKVRDWLGLLTNFTKGVQQG